MCMYMYMYVCMYMYVLVSQARLCSSLKKLLLGVAIVGGDTRRKESVVKCLQVIDK